MGKEVLFFYWWLSNVMEEREDFECIIISLDTSWAGLCYDTYISYMLTTKVQPQHNLHRYYNKDIVTWWNQIYVCLKHFLYLFWYQCSALLLTKKKTPGSNCPWSGLLAKNTMINFSAELRSWKNQIKVNYAGDSI